MGVHRHQKSETLQMTGVGAEIQEILLHLKRRYLKLSTTKEEPLCEFLKRVFQTVSYSGSHFNWVKDLKRSVKITQAHKIHKQGGTMLEKNMSCGKLRN